MKLTARGRLLADVAKVLLLIAVFILTGLLTTGSLTP